MSTVNIPDGWSSEAHILFLNGKSNEAINLILNELKKGTSVQRSNQIAHYYRLSCQYKDALMFYQLYLNFKKNDIHTLEYIVLCLIKIKNYKKCIEYCNNIISIDKENCVAFDGLSYCFGYLGDIDRARKAGEKSLVIKDKKYICQSSNLKTPTDEEIKKIILSAKRKKCMLFFNIRKQSSLSTWSTI